MAREDKSFGGLRGRGAHFCGCGLRGPTKPSAPSVEEILAASHV